MPLFIVRQDITRMNVDAIVNAANNSLLGGGGVDGAIHRAAGPKLLEECRTLGGCDTGDAKITGAYDLPCRYVIHTVGPIWSGGAYGEENLLYSCYKKSLELAVKNGCESVAFPLISSGVYGYPREDAFSVAVRAISDFLNDNYIDVYLTVLFAARTLMDRDIYSDISSYIRERETCVVPGNFDAAMRSSFQSGKEPPCDLFASEVDGEEPEKKVRNGLFRRSVKGSVPAAKEKKPAPVLTGAHSEVIDEKYLQLDESFSQMLLRKIDEKGMKDSECYKKANVDRKLFSKIRSDPAYRPSKITAIAFAIALELSLDETKDLLMKAGFALSHSSKFDLIVEYFIVRGNYDIFVINEALFAFDQATIC